MFLSDQEELYACGMNDLGQLGIDNTKQELEKFKMNLTARSNRQFETSVDIGTPTKLDVFQGMQVKNVSCGENHSMAVINSGEGSKKMLWGWGMFKQGQLGIGPVQSKQNP